MKYVLLGLLAVSWTKAQPLQTYLEELRLNNPELLALEARIQAQGEMVTVAKALPDPQLGVAVNLETVETRVGPQYGRLSISQMVPGFGKRALREALALKQQETMKEEYQSARLRLESEFRKLFADLYLLGQTIEINRTHLELLRELEEVVTERYVHSLAPYQDLTRIQIEIDKMQDRILTQERLAFPIMAKMCRLLGRAVLELPFPTALPPVPSLDDKESLLQNSMRENPSLRATHHKQKAADLQMDLAAKERVPDFRFGIDYIPTGTSAMNPPDNGKDPIMVSVGVSLPIWRKKIRAQQGAAAFHREAVDHELNGTSLQIESLLEQSLYELDDAQRKMDLFGVQILPKARESLEVILTGFQNNTASFLDLIQAENALLEFSLMEIEAQSRRYKAFASVLAITAASEVPHETP